MALPGSFEAVIEALAGPAGPRPPPPIVWPPPELQVPAVRDFLAREARQTERERRYQHRLRNQRVIRHRDTAYLRRSRPYTPRDLRDALEAASGVAALPMDPLHLVADYAETKAEGDPLWRERLRYQQPVTTLQALEEARGLLGLSPETLETVAAFRGNRELEEATVRHDHHQSLGRDVDERSIVHDLGQTGRRRRLLEQEFLLSRDPGEQARLALALDSAAQHYRFLMNYQNELEQDEMRTGRSHPGRPEDEGFEEAEEKEGE